MKRLATLCVLVAALAGVSGCANDSADGLVKQQIAVMNEQADAIEKNAPESTAKALQARMAEIQKKAAKRPAPEMKQAMERNQDAFRKAVERLFAAGMKKAANDMKGIFSKDKGK